MKIVMWVRDVFRDEGYNFASVQKAFETLGHMKERSLQHWLS